MVALKRFLLTRSTFPWLFSCWICFLLSFNFRLSFVNHSLHGELYFPFFSLICSNGFWSQRQARMLLRSLVLIGVILGVALSFVGTFIPWRFPYMFTSDQHIIQEVKPHFLYYFFFGPTSLSLLLVRWCLLTAIIAGRSDYWYCFMRNFVLEATSFKL